MYKQIEMLTGGADHLRFVTSVLPHTPINLVVPFPPYTLAPSSCPSFLSLFPFFHYSFLASLFSFFLPSPLLVLSVDLKSFIGHIQHSCSWAQCGKGIIQGKFLVEVCILYLEYFLEMSVMSSRKGCIFR